MKMNHRILAVFVLVCLFTGIIGAGIVDAQLILVNLKCKIVKADRPSNRLEIRVHEGDNKNIQYILMNDKTKFSARGKELTFDQAWAEFKPEMVIRVKGGYTVDMKVKAKYIYW